MTDHSRRQKVLHQLNTQLQSRRKGILHSLGVTGSKLPLYEPTKSVNELKPSRIPRPSTPSRPLPPPGYVSEILTAHRTIPPSNGQRQLTVVLHGLPESNTTKEKSSLSKSTRSKTREPSIEKSVRKISKKVANAEEQKVRKSGDSNKAIVVRKHMNRPVEITFKKQLQLKARHLAQKYGGVWLRKVFGRVSPSAARTYHAHTLLRRVLQIWIGEWWTARCEWKLNIRAECHDRYRLWQLVWAAWTQYTVECKEKRRLKERADNFFSVQLKRWAWCEWHDYVEVKRGRVAEKKQADHWRASQLVGHVWRQWRAAVERVRGRQAMDTQALHHWAHRLTEKVWQSWLERLHVKQVLRQHEEVAIHHHSQTLLLSTWAAWWDYLMLRRDKKAMKGFAIGVHCSRLLSRVFEGWRGRLERVRQIAVFQEHIIAHGRLALKRRVFQRWRFYVSLRVYKAHLLELCRQFHQFSLKSRALDALSVYSKHQQWKVDNQQLARVHRTRMLLQRCWRVWMCGCEHREEIKMGPQTRAALAHWSRVIRKRLVTAWVHYTLYRRERRRLKSIADEQFRTCALPRCFAALRLNVEVQLYKRELRGSADDFRRETLLSLGFYQWWREAQLSQDMRMLERVAILHNEEVRKRHLLQLWRVRTRERVRHITQEATAVAHYHHWKMGVVFYKWSSQLKTLLTGREQLYQATSHHGNHLLSAVWSAWKKYIHKRRFSSSRKLLAFNHYKKMITHKVVLAWKTFHFQCRVRNIRRLKAQAHFSAILQRRIFASWINFVSVSRNRQHFHSVAVDHFKIITLKKYFGVWLDRTAESIDHQTREDQQVEETARLLSRTRVSRLLHKWRDYSTSSLCARLAKEKAEAHHWVVIKRRCFAAWKDYHHLRLKTGLLTRQGEWFLRNRLLSTCYSQWRVQFMHSLVLRQQEVRALWHWSEGLQRRCLSAWLLYTLQRRRKKERYSEALDRHRRRLLTIGVSQWIKVATQLQAQRESIALQHQAKNAQSVLRCVRRCVTHWIAVTKRRANCRGVARPRAALVGPGRHTHSDSIAGHKAGEEWSSLLKSLQLPDGGHRERPQPRRFELSFTSNPPHHHISHPPQFHTSHPLSDTQPRKPLLPAPHPLTHHQPQQSSFTFLTSTCSGASQTELSNNSGDTYILEAASLEHSAHHGLNRDVSLSDDQRTERLSHSSANVDTVPEHLHKPLLPVYSDSSSLLTFDSRNSYSLDSEQAAATHTLNQESHRSILSSCEDQAPREQDPEESDVLPPSLNDPSVQREMVQIRNILKHFHQLKTRKKGLERTLSSLTEQKNADEFLKVKLELASLSHTLASRQPLIRQCALRISKLLTQSLH